jgi:hypothetical protein
MWQGCAEVCLLVVLVGLAHLLKKNMFARRADRTSERQMDVPMKDLLPILLKLMINLGIYSSGFVTLYAVLKADPSGLHRFHSEL